MEGINLKIKKNDPNALQSDDAIDEGNQNTAGMTDLRPDPKLVQSLWADQDELHQYIDKLRAITAQGLQNTEISLWNDLSKHFNSYKQELMDDSRKKKQNDEDPLVREQTLNEQLELMTHMAQQLDKEHRKLKNQE